MKKVYPLEGDPDLLHVCWSVWQQLKDSDHRAIVHIVHEGGNKTLCGKRLVNRAGRSLWWDYEIWGGADDYWVGVEDVGCKRCQKSRLLIEVEE